MLTSSQDLPCSVLCVMREKQKGTQRHRGEACEPDQWGQGRLPGGVILRHPIDNVGGKWKVDVWSGQNRMESCVCKDLESREGKVRRLPQVQVQSRPASACLYTMPRKREDSRRQSLVLASACTPFLPYSWA